MRLLKILFLLWLVAAPAAWARTNDFEIALATPEQLARLLVNDHLLQPDEGALRAAAWRAVGGSGSWTDLRSKMRTDSNSVRQALQVAARVMNAMLAEVGDPYTFMLSKAEREWEMGVQKSGKFTGIGVELAPRNGLTVVACLDGGPAARSGLKAGDRILAIDGESVAQETFYAAGNRLLGPPGRAVRLAIERGQKNLSLEIPRAQLTLPGVRGKHIQGDVGLLQIGFFGPRTAADVRRNLSQLKSLGVRQLVLDLRSNPGGDFVQGREVATLFGSGTCLHLEERPGEVRALSAAEQDPDHWNGPLVVLIDGGTASAAEMVAAAIKGRGQAVLVGQRSFGKARIQSLYNLPGGGAVNLSTGRFLGPRKEPIHDVGIEPNVVERVDPMKRALGLLL